MLEHVGVRVPEAVRPAFEQFTGARAVRQVIEASPRREASGWLEDALMIGGEDGDTGLQARGQFHPATVHWRQPDGTVGWLRVEHHGPTRARTGERRLVVDCDAHPDRGAQPVRWITNTTPRDVQADRWALPGLDVEVETTASLSATAAPDLRVRPPADHHLRTSDSLPAPDANARAALLAAPLGSSGDGHGRTAGRRSCGAACACSGTRCAPSGVPSRSPSSAPRCSR